MLRALCRNPFLSRAGFDVLSLGTRKKERIESRNPFLSRAGFDKEKISKMIEQKKCRNPFLSRAGFDSLRDFGMK